MVMYLRRSSASAKLEKTERKNENFFSPLSQYNTYLVFGAVFFRLFGSSIDAHTPEKINRLHQPTIYRTNKKNINIGDDAMYQLPILTETLLHLIIIIIMRNTFFCSGNGMEWMMKKPSPPTSSGIPTHCQIMFLCERKAKNLGSFNSFSVCWVDSGFGIWGFFVHCFSVLDIIIIIEVRERE